VSTLVLITGTGRSGTSTMSGTLDHLGLHVPGPYLGANKSNPKGFFESRWSVQFHKRITSGAGINDFDSRPDAFALAQAAVTDELRTELREFLARESREHDQVVVKDPRSVWAQRVWREAAERAGLEITYISMLRHPAEVVGSRTTYYATPADEAARHSYETFNVARWVNSSLVSERETRGQRRAFVSYVDLLHDWRPVLVGLAQDLGLSYDVDVAGGESSSVDEFIDPGLRRHQVTWDDLGVPEDLRSIAEAVWGDLLELQAGHGVDAAASADLDLQAERYRALFTMAADIAHDNVETERRRLRELTQKPRKGKRQDEQPRGTQPAAKAARTSGGERSRQRSPSTPPGAGARAAGRPRVEDLPVGQVGGRDLLRVIVARARRRLSRG
jgi:hypothetical protein